MINFIKRFFLKRKLCSLYNSIQVLTERKFSLRMKSIDKGQAFVKTVLRLEELGVKNPKELVLGLRPKTGKIK